MIPQRTTDHDRGLFQSAHTVTVFVPTSGALSPASPFAISPAPQLTLSATQVTAGTAVTMTLAGGFGGSTDWLALASTTAPNNGYLQYTYVGAGVSARTWTVPLTTPGTYEFRLFTNGYTRIATSAPITVTAVRRRFSQSARRRSREGRLSR